MLTITSEQADTIASACTPAATVDELRTKLAALFDLTAGDIRAEVDSMPDAVTRLALSICADAEGLLGETTP
jgi:hypothetical protein